MSLTRRLVELLRGTEPRMRRMLRYWAATCVLYLACIALILVQVSLGMTDPEPAYRLTGYGAPGVIVFYGLIRFRAPAEVAIVVLAAAAMAELASRRSATA